MADRLQEKYEKEIRSVLQKQFNYENVNLIPKLVKVSVNMGVGDAVSDSKVINHAVSDLTLITGQKPVISKAKKSEASFKVRADMPIGCKVTLRRQNMYEFIDRLTNIALPRVRDFRGLSSKSFDGRGNFSLGIKEQIIFPEIEYDKVDKVRGMDITVVTTAKTKEEGKALLEALNFPFRN